MKITKIPNNFTKSKWPKLKIQLDESWAISNWLVENYHYDNFHLIENTVYFKNIDDLVDFKQRCPGWIVE